MIFFLFTKILVVWIISLPPVIESVIHPSDGSSSSSSSSSCCVGTTMEDWTTMMNQHPDLVHHLPGFGPPPTPWFSGYLHYELAGQTVHTHYILQTAVSTPEDDDNDDEKPLIYWSNGGPGASSMFGLLTELGPLLLNDASLNTDSYRDTDIPTFLYNPYSWNRLGHLLSFDQPAPVGFSYCNTMQDHTMHPHSCGGIAWTDELTAENAYRALLAFYDKFPCLQSKSLFLTGESYAGIYIPTLAREIVQNNQQISPTDTITTATTIPLEGFAVGDGCLGTQTGICGVLGDNPDGFDVWNILFLAGHGQIPMSTFREVMHACVQSPPDDHDNNDHADDTDWAQLFLRGMGSHRDTMKLLKMNDSACQAALKKVDDQAGGVYAYGLYDECTYRNGMMLKSGVNDYACGGDLVMTDYLNRHDVQDALHVQSDFYSVDNAAGDFNYTPTEPDLTGFYKEMNGKLRILVYNGDTDPAINSFAAQNWTSHLGLEEVESWRPWTVDGCRRMGGYVTRYVGGFEFLTIRGAGHMVPTIKPAAAFTLIKAWIQGSPYPAYDKDCKKPSDRQRNDQVSLDEKNHRAQPIE